MFILKFMTGNSAFESPEELGRILRAVAFQTDMGERTGQVRDINGNTVGRWDADE